MSEQLVPARWPPGQHDDTARFFGYTFRPPPVQPIRMDVYQATPDEFGADPPIYVANVGIIIHSTFRGLLVTGRWYEVKRPGIEGPPNDSDKLIANWEVLGEGFNFAMPIVVDAGGGAKAGLIDGDTYLTMLGAWVVSSAIFVGERFGAAWLGKLDTSASAGSGIGYPASMHNYVMECPEGS